MALTYPLNLPSSPSPRSVVIRARSVVGIAVSPFSMAQQIYAHQGDCWEMDIELPPMQRAAAADWQAFFLGLNGMEGTFLMGDPVNTAARGSWAGASPLVNGASQTGKTLAVKSCGAGATIKAGDWLQLGSGTSAHIHQVVQDATADGSGNATLEIWPRLRSSPADAAAITIASPKGAWRLASNVREYSIDIGQIYGFKFSAIESLTT